jgi:Flp pilus assembly protein TadG
MRGNFSMPTLRPRWRPVPAFSDRRAVAALEFALVAPLLLLLLGGVVDYALAFVSKGILSASVSQGAQYAALAGTSATAANVKSVVQKTLSLPSANVTVSGPACYCVMGTPAVATSKTCGQSCSDSSIPGTYLTIAASYTYTPQMPLMSKLGNTVLTESAWIRVQ